MNLRFLRVLSSLAMVVLLLAEAPPASAQSWSDEFNGSGAAAGSWTYDVGGGGWGNGELQYYQSGSANAYQTGGFLQIQARRQSVGGMAYTSARLKTLGRVSFGPYGRMEGRMQGPNGQGLWPAFWMMGTNIATNPWPGCGEIDIMEHINSASNVLGTIHWNNGGHVSYTGMNVSTYFPAWHTYGINWTSSSITWTLDGNSVGSANIQNSINSTEEFHRSFFILLNLAVGGAWPGNPSSSTVFPANFNIDWVRWWNSGGTPTPTPPPSDGISTTAWYSLANQTSGKCIDRRTSGTANGTAVQQYACNNTYAQQWQFQATSGGYYRLAARGASSQVMDVSGVSLADGALIHLWSWGGGNNQQWLPQSMGNGYYRLVARHSGKCLDVPGASTADSVQLVQYACNGTGAQSFRLVQQP